MKQLIERNQSLIYRLQPFDLEQAKYYFSHRLKNQKQADYATATYQTLGRESKPLLGRGFVLSLLADLAERTVGGAATYGDEKYPLLWLMESLCEREVLRQELPVSASEQMSILRTLAIESATGEPLSTDLLEYAITSVRQSLDGTSVANAMEKMKSHPLVEYSKHGDMWSFRQEQIRIMLIAEQMIKWPPAEVDRFMQKAALSAAARQDVGSAIVDLLQRESTVEAVDHLSKICQALSSSSASSPRTNDGRRLAATIALIGVDSLLPAGSSHLDRAKFLLRICGGSTIEALTFSGTIARYDLSAVAFKRCGFDHSTWANCKFDEKTVFTRCEFLGGNQPGYCQGLGSALFVDCTLDPEAQAMMNGVRVKEGKKKYSVDELKVDVNCVLSKFVIKGGIAFKTVNEHNVKRGTIAVSRHRDEIMEVLLSTILEKRKISDGLVGYNVRGDAVEAVKFYAANNVFTGPLRDAFDKLRLRLSLS